MDLEHDGNIDSIIPTSETIQDALVQRHIMRYDFAKEFVHDDRILDVACGVGYGTWYLSNFVEEVYGVDINRKTLEIASDKYRKYNTEYLMGDVLELPFADSCFRTIVSFETIEHIANEIEYINEIKRVLKPSGTFICSTPEASTTTNPPAHINEFSQKRFFSLFEDNFQMVGKYGQYMSEEALPSDGISVTGELLSIGDEVLSYMVFENFLRQLIRYYILGKAKTKEIYKPDNDDIERFKQHSVTDIDSPNGKVLRGMIAVGRI